MEPFDDVNSPAQRRRRSDDPAFVETNPDLDALADSIFEAYSGEQRLVIDGVPATATFFSPEYCPDYRVMKLAGRLAVAINRRSQRDGDGPDAVRPLRVTVREIMLAALLHDLGKHHEDCSPFLQKLQQTDLRGETMADEARRAHLLGLVRDIHCRKGPCMIDRLRDAGRAELQNPFIGTVARRHGDDYEANRSTCWWPREINVITLADDYDAIVSSGPERAYKARSIMRDEAVTLLHVGVERGRYEPQITRIFIEDVLNRTPS